MAADGTFGDSNLHNCVHTGQLMRLRNKFDNMLLHNDYRLTYLVDHVADVELVACGQACNDVHKAGDAADGALVDDVDLVAVQLAGPLPSLQESGGLRLGFFLDVIDRRNNIFIQSTPFRI